MELIGKQIAIETILGQPPELHYPSWYARQIEDLPPAPPEYLAEQAGILVTDADTISRAKAIDALRKLYITEPKINNDYSYDMALDKAEDVIKQLPPAQPAQHTPDQNGDLWITVPDIDEVTCVYVQESKSKFCRIFYEER